MSIMAQLKTNSSAEMPSKVEDNLINWDKVFAIQDAIVKIMVSFLSQTPIGFYFPDVIRWVKASLKSTEGADEYAVMAKVLQVLIDRKMYLCWKSDSQEELYDNGAFHIRLYRFPILCGGVCWYVMCENFPNGYLSFDRYQDALAKYCNELAYYNLEKERIASFV